MKTEVGEEDSPPYEGREVESLRHCRRLEIQQVWVQCEGKCRKPGGNAGFAAIVGKEKESGANQTEYPDDGGDICKHRHDRTRDTSLPHPCGPDKWKHQQMRER